MCEQHVSQKKTPKKTHKCLLESWKYCQNITFCYKENEKKYTKNHIAQLSNCSQEFE